MNKLIKFAALFMALLLAAALVGCSKAENGEAAAESGAGESGVLPAASAASATSPTPGVLELSARDMEGGWEDASATHITLSGTSASIEGNGAVAEQGSLSIVSAGTYVLSGSFTGCVIVECAETDKVQLVMNNAYIANTSGPALYISRADKVFITLAEGTENALSDGASYAFSDEKADAALYSKEDLTLNGTGSLVITASYKHGIACNDDLVIYAAALSITSVGDGIHGKDSVQLAEASIAITAGDDGVQADNAEDEGKGYIVISGGTLEISATADGVQAEQALTMLFGSVTVSRCDEGLEGRQVAICGGELFITASDDGINASVPSTATSSATVPEGQVSPTQLGEPPAGHPEQPTGEPPADRPELPDNADIQPPADPGFDPSAAPAGGQGKPGGKDDFPGNFGGNGVPGGMGQMGGESADADTWILITGGVINIDAQGDGLDSNGSIYVNGGEVYITGPASGMEVAMDYNGVAEINGGTVIGTGSSGMAQNFSGGTQASLLVSFADQQAGEFALYSGSTQLAGYSVLRGCQSLLISLPALSESGEYTLKTPAGELAVSMTGLITSVLDNSGPLTQK